MIDPKAEPVFNIPPYRRIDHMRPNHKLPYLPRRVTKAVWEWMKANDEPVPSKRFYDFNKETQEYVLRKEFVR